MSLIKKVLTKYKAFFSDMVLNMIGFGIYIFSQQILLLPILAKNVDDIVYSSFVLYLSILNVVCNVTGGELGNVRLVRNSDYKAKNIMGDFSRILLFISPIITVIVFPILIYLKYSIIGSIVLVLTILMANVRLYSTCYYRLEQKYSKVILQNICYLIGIIISLILYKYIENIYLILFVPELISIAYAIFNSDLLKMKLTKTTEMLNTVKKFVKLGIVSFLTNLTSYFDKFLIYPMFGAGMIAIYYACNSMSKITSLITNPVSNVILSWVSKSNDSKNKNKILRLTILANIPVIFIVTLVTIPCTYIALKILYSQYLEGAISLIIPIAIASGFGTAATLTKSVLLKYVDTNKLLGSYIVYFVILTSFGFLMSKTWGLTGFAIANLSSKIILCIMFIVLLIITIKKGEMKVEDEKQNI